MNEIQPWHIVSVIGAITVGLLSWVGNKQIERIDRLEEAKADRDHVKDRFDAVIKRLDDQDTRSNIRDQKIDRILEIVVSK
jgi:hypothetical protein